MSSLRPITRSSLSRAARSSSLRVPIRQHPRFQSTTSSASSASASGSSSPYVAGAVGGVVGATALYGIYLLTPAGQVQSKINKAAKEANKKYNAAVKKLDAATPDNADQVVDSIKQLAYTYVGWVPGGRAYVETAFADLDKVREKHRGEVDEILGEAYKRFKEVAKGGLSLETLAKAYEVLADVTKRMAELAGDAAGDVLDNHPEIKEKLGGNVDQLRQMGEQYGPEAKKQVDETWRQVKDLFAGGLGVGTLEKARQLIQDKVEQVRKLGDEAWQKGMEEAKPLLEKNPKVKELVEKNSDLLKQGNFKELFDKVKSAVESGDLGGLEKYVQSATDKAKSAGEGMTGKLSGLDQYTKMIPQADEILPKLQQLAEIAGENKEEGEKLLKATVEDLKKVLEKRSKEAQDIVDKAKKDAKKDAKN